MGLEGCVQQLVHTQSKIKSVHALKFYTFNTRFNIILSFTRRFSKRSLYFGISSLYLVCISVFNHM
jgi:hypothetical protein